MGPFGPGWPCLRPRADPFSGSGGEITVGLEAQVSVLIVEAKAGVKALEGVITLEGAAGHLTEVRSPYGIQVVDQTPRTLRFRWLDIEDQVGQRAQDVELLRVGVFLEEAGEIKISLSIPFLVTDTGASSAPAVESEPLVVRAPAEGNEPPQANDDSATTEEGTAVTVDVIANDVDPDGRVDPATVTIVSGPEGGSAMANEDGTITYTPDEGFVGTDIFRYTVQDDKDAISNIATVTVAVQARPSPPPPSEPSPPPTEPKGLPSLRMAGGQWTFGQPGWIVLEFNAGAGGLRRLELELMVTDPNLINLSEVEWQGFEEGTWEVVEVDIGRWRVRLADLFDQVQPGTEELRASIQLSFQALGTTELSVRSVQGLDDSGQPFTAADLAVELSCVLGSLEPRWARPGDLDGDGRFEDLDGDGKLTLHDALLLAFHYDRFPLSSLPKVVDFDGDGTLTFADAQTLAHLVLP